MTESWRTAVAEARGLEDIYPILAQRHFTAGWHKKRRSLWPKPKTEYQPLHWRYAEAAVALEQAARWIGTEDAERRNLMMFNPVGDNDYDTLRTLVAAYQTIEPGEHARAHRHTPNAMRLMLDGGPGVYTVVDGVQVPMRPGDLLLTPSWCWHSHFSNADATACWIDVLDVPLVHRLEPMFFEEHPAVYQTVTSHANPDSCPLVFPRSKILEALRSQPPLPGGERRLSLASQDQIRTLALSYIWLPEGARSLVGRTTANRIFAVSSGRGVARLAEQSIEWARGDVFCLPSWNGAEIEAGSDALILEISDEPTLRLLGFYREESPLCDQPSCAESSSR